MGSTIGGKKNVKIFVLYLMGNINYPLDFITLNDIVMQTDYVMYLDFAEGFHEMLRDSLIEVAYKDESGTEYYRVTNRGRFVAAELKSDILDVILDQSLACALRYLDFKRRDVKVECSSEKQGSDFILHCSFTEAGKMLFKLDLVVDSANRVERMKENFRERPETIFRGVNALLAGNVNYLFD